MRHVCHAPSTITSAAASAETWMKWMLPVQIIEHGQRADRQHRRADI